MKKGIGLWIDHRKAVVVLVSNEGEKITEITSDMEKHVRFTEGATMAGSSETCAIGSLGTASTATTMQSSPLFVTETPFRYLAQARPKANSKNALRVKGWVGASWVWKPLTR